MITNYSNNAYAVEPVNVSIHYCVTSVSVGNYPRKVATPPLCSGGNQNVPYYAQVNDIVWDSQDLTGRLVLKDGFNCRISQRGNTFTVDGALGHGASLTEERCHEIPIGEVEIERLSNNNANLVGGVMCNQVLKSINGLNAENIVINGGAGVKVTREDEHTLKIALDTQRFEHGCSDS